MKEKIYLRRVRTTHLETRKKYSYKEAKMLIGKYCAYQERCQSETRKRLYQYGLVPDEVEELISELITLNFLNEERFALAFARGKFNQKKWGKVKIKQHLKSKDISDQNIKLALSSIESDKYEVSLQKLLEQKWNGLSDKNQFTKKRKVADFLIRKGYESTAVWDLLRENYSSGDSRQT